MIEINITEREKELLQNSMKYNSSIITYKLEGLLLKIEKDEIHTLENLTNGCLLDYFLAEGLQKNDEPNALGLEIEKLQDKFICELQRYNDGES